MDFFELLGVTKEKVASFCHKERIELMIVFGSYATGRTHRESDLDIAVKFPHDQPNPDLLNLIGKLDILFNGKANIDVVILNPSTGLLLKHEIFSQGKLLYKSKKELFIDESTKAWIAYQDAKPIFNRHHMEFMRWFHKECGHVS